MNSFVFTRHISDCKHKHDRQYRRCNCPKWVEARVNGERIRKSASPRIWDEAELFRQEFKNSVAQGLPPTASGVTPVVASTPASALPGPIPAAAAQVALPRKHSSIGYDTPSALASPGFAVVTTFSASEILAFGRRPRVTVRKAVAAYMTDAHSRGLQSDTIKKLERLFEKQFLPWCTVEGLEYLDQVDLDALLHFRSTWTESALVKIKKQERIIGFFGDSFRRNYISQNPALSMSKIRHKQVPTDYFPRAEFERIIQATCVYGDSRGGYIPIEDTRTRSDGFWIADRRDPEPLERPVGWFEPRTDDWQWGIQKKDFDRVLGLGSDRINVWGHWVAGDSSRTETIQIYSALVSSQRPQALLRATQTSEDPQRYRIPPTDDELEIDSGPYQLKGWIDNDTKYRQLDDFDPWSGCISVPAPRPAKFVREALALMPAQEERIWFHTQAANWQPVLWSQVWGMKNEDDGEGRGSGTRLQASPSFLIELLNKLQMDLIIKVQLKRETRQSRYDRNRGEDHGYIPPCCRLFLLSAQGDWTTV